MKFGDKHKQFVVKSFASDMHFARITETTEDAERHLVIPFLNNNFSLTRNAFVVAQFIAKSTPNARLAFGALDIWIY